MRSYDLHELLEALVPVSYHTWHKQNSNSKLNSNKKVR